MFDIGWGELVVIGVVALIAIGPKELPGVLRAIGQWTGKIRRMASEFQGQFQEAMREAEMADIKKSVDEISTSASNFTSFDPLGDVQKNIESGMPAKPLDDAPGGASTPAADPPIDVPPPDLPPPVTEKDFAPQETVQQAAVQSEPAKSEPAAAPASPPKDGGRAA